MKTSKSMKRNHTLYPIPTSNAVEHPSHYTFGKFEVIDVLMDWFPSDPLLWQVGKYIARASHKGNKLEDLKKASWYLQRKIDLVETSLRGEGAGNEL